VQCTPAPVASIAAFLWSRSVVLGVPSARGTLCESCVHKDVWPLIDFLSCCSRPYVLVHVGKNTSTVQAGSGCVLFLSVPGLVKCASAPHSAPCVRVRVCVCTRRV